MTEKITIHEMIHGKRTLMTSCIMNAMGEIHGEDFGIINGETKEIEVDFKINGISVSIRSYLDYVEEDLDRMIEVEAANLLRERIGLERFESLNNIKKMVRKLEVELFEKYFPNDPEFNET